MWKNRLQEWCQSRRVGLPAYNTAPAGLGGRASTVTVEGLPPMHGTGCGKKVAAEQDAARQACMLLDRITAADERVAVDAVRVGSVGASTNAADERVGLSRPAGVTVHVDADQVSFVDDALVAAHPDVHFSFYCAHGANLPHVRRACAHGNATQLHAPRPLPNMADVMICIAVARRPCGAAALIVSRDKMLFNLTELLDNVAYVSTREQLEEWLRPDSGGTLMAG